MDFWLTLYGYITDVYLAAWYLTMGDTNVAVATDNATVVDASSAAAAAVDDVVDASAVGMQSSHLTL